MSNPGYPETHEADLEPEFLNDPYAIAYLSGGTHALLQLHLFEFVQKGYLIVTEAKRWWGKDRLLLVAPDLPPLLELTEVRRELLTWFSEPQTASDTFERLFPKQLQIDALTYRETFLERGFLAGSLIPENLTRYWQWVGLIALTLFVGLNIFSRLPSPGSVTIPGTVAYFFVCAILGEIVHWFVDIRLSARGRNILWRLKNQFDDLRHEVKNAQFDISEPIHLLALALFGSSILSDSPYNSFSQFLGDCASTVYGIDKGGYHDGGGP